MSTLFRVTAALASIFAVIAVATPGPVTGEPTPPTRNGLLVYDRVYAQTPDDIQFTRIEEITPRGRKRGVLPCASGPPGCFDVLPVFAQDGRRLATTTSIDYVESEPFIAIRGPRGRILRRIPGHYGTSGLAWSPDRKRLAIATSRGVFIRSLATGRERRISRVETDGVAWSRDGRLAWDDGVLRGDLYLRRPRGRHTKRLRARAVEPEWSPNGRRILFECLRPGRGVCAIDATGAHRSVLATECWAFEGSQPAWSPDGNQIACQGKNGALLAIRLVPRRVRVLRRFLTPLSIDWQPRP